MCKKIFEQTKATFHGQSRSRISCVTLSLWRSLTNICKTTRQGQSSCNSIFSSRETATLHFSPVLRKCRWWSWYASRCHKWMVVVCQSKAQLSRKLTGSRVEYMIWVGWWILPSKRSQKQIWWVIRSSLLAPATIAIPICPYTLSCFLVFYQWWPIGPLKVVQAQLKLSYYFLISSKTEDWQLSKNLSNIYTRFW